MTGYGKAESPICLDNKKIVVELRSLNSKSIDLNVRLAQQLRNKELEIRSLIAQRLERGKIDLSIYYQSADSSTQTSNGQFTPINKDAFAFYYHQIKEMQRELAIAE